MPAKCCVPECKSNYDSTVSSAGYVSVFKIPTNVELREMWLKCIPRKNWTPSNSSVVCLKHFLSSDIIVSDKYIDKQGVEHTLPRKSPALKRNAYPTVFQDQPSNLPVKVGCGSAHLKQSQKSIKTHRSHDDITVKEDINSEEENDISPVILKARTSSTTLSFPDEGRFLYCEECQLKYEGDCPEHGTLIYGDNAEATRNMNVQSLLPSESIKHEPDWNPSAGDDTTIPISVGQMKQELDNDGNIMNVTENEEKQSAVCGEHEGNSSCVQGCSPISKVVYLPVMSDDRHLELGKQDNLLGSLIGRNCIHINKNSGREDATCATSMLGGKPVTCDVCGARFTKKENLTVHTRKHTGEKPYICEICGLGFSSRSSLTLHRNAHTGQKPYTCDVCGSRFTKHTTLTEHKRRHTGEKLHLCDVCGKGYAWRSDLKRHQGKHTGEKLYQCEFCGAKFFRVSALKVHKRSHTGEKPYKCDICQVRYSSFRTLRFHKIIHTGEKPYKFNAYSTASASLGNLIIHHRTHTGEKPYMCNICGKGTFSISNLRTHQRTHTGEKPYKCDICGSTFTASSTLKSHHLIHTGEKPHKCVVCGSGFITRTGLKSHKQTHTGEKPCKCNVCGLCFAVPGYLQKHIKRHLSGKI